MIQRVFLAIFLGLFSSSAWADYIYCDSETNETVVTVYFYQSTNPYRDSGYEMSIGENIPGVGVRWNYRFALNEDTDFFPQDAKLGWHDIVYIEHTDSDGNFVHLDVKVQDGRPRVIRLNDEFLATTQCKVISAGE